MVPTTPIAATRLGEDSVPIAELPIPRVLLLLRLNRPANLAGVPAVSVPCGLTKTGLPIGLQFIAEWTDEPLLLEIARTFEREFPHGDPPTTAKSRLNLQACAPPPSRRIAPRCFMIQLPIR